ncbi:hypothetical protein KOW79_021027 [Hemibagrus wyckioides]|uniref:Ig-like domain-containing protein n=2 Tax=Hemibagrus wyckioides TaxID=337641 RepID=A0A9D3S9B5_9TELE|nr:hypothetical protein KOW79_021027 [Hemibagrus wyckioides]
MKNLHTFILCFITVRTLATKTVTAYTGGGIILKCRYEDKLKHKTKSFCKMETEQSCMDQIKTEAHKEWTHKDRFSIQDTRRAEYFSVMIRELTVEDTGTYRCVLNSDETSIYTVIRLNVIEDLSYDRAISKTVLVGGDMTIRCRYPNSYRSEPKFFCRMLQNGVCTYKTSLKKGRNAVEEGKISQHDDQAKQVFTVSIKHMSKRDSGKYWCGVEAAEESEPGYKVYITHIDVMVTEPHLTASQRPSSLLSTSTYLLPKNSNKTSTTHPSPTSLLTGFISVSVILAVLLVFLISFLTLTSVRSTSPILPVPRTIHEVPSAGTRRISNQLFSTVQLPTIPIDSSHAVYANTQGW